MDGEGRGGGERGRAKGAHPPRHGWKKRGEGKGPRPPKNHCKTTTKTNCPLTLTCRGFVPDVDDNGRRPARREGGQDCVAREKHGRRGVPLKRELHHPLPVRVGLDGRFGQEPGVFLGVDAQALTGWGLCGLRGGGP
jgi:hypothetical protein